jgi:hypothetical protein
MHHTSIGLNTNLYQNDIANDFANAGRFKSTLDQVQEILIYSNRIDNCAQTPLTIPSIGWSCSENARDVQQRGEQAAELGAKHKVT